MAGATDGLLSATVGALKWNYVGAAARALAQVAISAVLGRLLGPEPFGLIAVAWVVIGLGNLVADFGFSAALVQSKHIDNEHVRYAFTLQMLASTALTVVVAVAAAPIVRLFGATGAVPIIRWLSLLFIVQACGQTATSLLRRELDFKTIQVAQTVSYLVAFGLVGIPLAYAGLEVWSLVVAQLGQGLLYALLVYRRVRHSVRPLLQQQDTGFVRFGGKVIATNVVNWSIGNLDNVFVGRFFGTLALGLYSRAYLLMTAPMTTVVSVMQGVLFSAYAKAQDDLETLGRVYLASVSAVSLVLLPVFGTIAVVPIAVMEGLYGSRWLEAAPLLTPLAVAMPFHAVMALAGPLIWGRGRVERELKAQIISALMLVAVLLVTGRVSVVVLAWGIVAAYIVRFFLMTQAVLNLIGFRWGTVLAAVRGSVLLCILTASLTWGADHFFARTGTVAGVRLAADISIAGVCYLSILACAPKLLLSEELMWLLARLAHRLPNPLRKIVVRASS